MISGDAAVQHFAIFWLDAFNSNTPICQAAKSACVAAFIHSPEPTALLSRSALHIYFAHSLVLGGNLNQMMRSLTARDASFLSLQAAVFCAECELISENNTPRCLGCGSQALLSLARVLGGSLKGQQTAHLIADAELDRLVHELLRTVPGSVATFANDKLSPPGAQPIPSRHHVRSRHLYSSAPGNRGIGTDLLAAEIQPAEMDLEPGINIITERAQALTGATGAAIALRKGNEIVCRARAGRTAPDLGVRLQTDSGLSADCVRRGEILLCHDAESNPQVDLASCRRLGARSILVAPLRYFRRTLGVFEVLSSAPYAFDHRDIATMQLLASMMVAAISRLSTLKPRSWQQAPNPQG
jgi:GAF domain-containing protein